MVKMKDVVYVKCQEFDPLSSRSDSQGMRTFWRADVGSQSIAYGDTKKECIEDARAYMRRNKHGK